MGTVRTVREGNEQSTIRCSGNDNLGFIRTHINTSFGCVQRKMITHPSVFVHKIHVSDIWVQVEISFP